MLEDGHPPDDWNDLLKEAKAETKRLVNAVNRQEMKAF
jgi:toxin YhaV